LEIDPVGPSDWTRFEWAVLREELDRTSRLAKKLRLWTVLGAVHRLSEPHRPHNSLYVISDSGTLVTRYDERMLSNTKASFMYSPGATAVTFEVDGVRLGCAMGMETHYPEIFMEYERLGVDCVLFSTTGEVSPSATAFAAEVLGHAASNSFWASYSAHAPQSLTVPSGIAAPDGTWAARCRADGAASIALADIRIEQGPERPWRRVARAGLVAAPRIDGDPRSDGRGSF